MKHILLICMITVLGLTSVLAAESRTALVIGNSDYKTISSLKNPLNDAVDMATALETLGFDVILKTNINLSRMRNAVRTFGDKIKKGGIGLFYYAGHGVQMDGVNYIIPIGVDIKRKYDVEDQTLKMNYVLGAMEEANNRLNIIILDACRDNPFRSFRGVGRGLARMDVPKGSIIAYATAPGEKAEDGTGRNGTYTGCLLKNIVKPDISVYQVFNNTGLEVKKKTNDTQTPWISSSPIPDYYLAGRSTVQAQAQPAAYQKQSVTPTAPSGQYSTPRPGDIWIEPVTGMEFVYVPGGCYQMGCGSWTDYCADDEKPVHEVCLDGFWIGRYEVTQGQYKKIMDTNPSYFKSGDNYPVETVSWHGAKEFVSRLNQQTGRNFRLPTEAQWEYAARSGGKNQKYAGGNDVDKLAWYASNSGSKTHPVGTKVPNDLGIYDMSGNVYEWCEDVYDKNVYKTYDRNNPIVTSGGG